MDEIVLKAYAKINLSIDVLSKMPNGYHKVRMLMQQVGLWDQVNVKIIKRGSFNQKHPTIIIQGLSSNIDLAMFPLDKKNIAYRAADKMIERFSPEFNDILHISIEKNIPIAAGLGGGSGNAAAVILAIVKLFKLSVTLKELMEIGTELGADVPFSIVGQLALNSKIKLLDDPILGTCALAEGIGEKLTKVSPLEGWILLAKPPISVSTADVYNKLELDNIKIRPNTEDLINGLNLKKYNQILKNMVNVLEIVSLKEYPKIVYTKNKIKEDGSAEHILMSGSGPTIFAYYRDEKKCKDAGSRLKTMEAEIFTVPLL